jgi:hypothetical protein
MAPHRATVLYSSSSKPVALSLSSSILAATTILFLLTTTTLTLVSAKGGHYSAAVSDTSGPCIKRCSEIYFNEMTSCESKFPNPTLQAHDRDYCRLDVANLFQHCSELCIPAAATFSDSPQ